MTATSRCCGHRHLSAKTSRYLHQHGEELLIVDDVPGLECDDCGEPYFDASVLPAIEAEHLAIVQRRKVPRAVRTVALDSYATLGH
jgi:YgiT-type zinc finger domain-containing protein